MALERLQNKKVVLVGFGDANKSFYSVLRKRYPELLITIADQNEDLDLPEDSYVKSILGKETYLKTLSEFDVIVRSPGMPVDNNLADFTDRVTTTTQLFFEEVRGTSKAKIIGVTGTKGKSTVSTLIHEILKAAGKKSFLVGNINIQAWDNIEEVDGDSIIVYELSSYMLNDFTDRSDISVWLNVYDDHLTWHGGREGYVEAKSRVASFQKSSDVCVYNGADDEVGKRVKDFCVTKQPYNIQPGFHIEDGFICDGDKKVIPVSDIKLIGSHVHENILAVLLVSRHLKISMEVVAGVLRTFDSLPHRLETVAVVNGVSFVDDLLATNPEATMAAIDSYTNVSCLILGGEDRGYDYVRLGKHVTEKHIPYVVLLPGCREKILRSLNGYAGEIFEANIVADAVTFCFQKATGQSTVLFSPSAPSYDQFANYKEKAIAFKSAIDEVVKDGLST
jgi:UDP-N-acetylmuramoyl-L-alanine---L-glutamate ligase